MNSKLFGAIVSGLGALLPASALAAACGTVTASPGTLNFSNWSALDGLAQDLPITLSIRPNSVLTKAVRVILTDPDTPSTPLLVSLTAGLRYEVTDVATGRQIAFPRGTTLAMAGAPSLPISGGTGTATDISARVRVFGNTGPVRDYVGGNSYSQTFLYSVQCLDQQGSVIAEDTLVPASVTVTVPITRAASIVTARPSTIDFGNFTSMREQIMITVRSTSSLNVSATTQNGGKLVREGTPQPWPDYATIPYNMFFWAQQLIPGANPVVVPRVGVAGRDINFRLFLATGLPAAKLAGTYSDIITLTVAPGQ